MHGLGVSAYTAHRERATRPPDERFQSVQALDDAARAHRLVERPHRDLGSQEQAVATELRTLPARIAFEAVNDGPQRLRRDHQLLLVDRTAPGPCTRSRVALRPRVLETRRCDPAGVPLGAEAFLFGDEVAR